MKTSSPSHLRSRFLAHTACFSHALVAFAGLTLGPQPARAAVTEAWVHRYNNVVSNSVDQAFKVVSDAADNIIVTGSTDDGNSQDILTIKYSGADGAVLWQNRYNGPADGNDQATAVAVDRSGNVVVTGFSQGDFYTAKYAAADGALLWEQRYSYGQGTAVAVDSGGNAVVTGFSGNGTNDDYYTAKYAAADGALLWEKRYNGPANSDDRAQAVAVDRNGNVVVTGYSYTATPGGESGNSHGDTDYYTAKYAAADGALLWEKRHSGGGQALAVDGSGNAVVTGYSSNGSGDDNSKYDYYTAKYAAANGTLLWEQRYNGPGDSDDQARAVAVDASDNVVVTGYSHKITIDEFGNPHGDTDYYTAKYAPADGALIWERRYNGFGGSSDVANAVAVDGNGNVVVTGVTGFCNGSWGCFYNYYTAKYAAADGALLWEKRGPATDHQAGAVAVDGSDNVVVTELSGFSGSDNDNDYYTAKHAAADGALLWEKGYNSLANNTDEARAVAVDGNGNVAVTGSSIGSGSNADYYTAKYAAATGALLWEKRYHGAFTYSGDGANAVAVDGSGNVVVTGSSGSHYYTAKYAAADGALLWEQRYEGGGKAVAVDGSGNVVVTGSSNGALYTAKYAAADGALLWEKRGPAGFQNVAVAVMVVAVDGSGNVVVTGSSWNAGYPDYYTAKYAAADGALLWEKRYNGPGSREDYAYAAAVDGSGNVVVTGSSIGSGGNVDYYTAKYAAADGALLWEKRYNGPANSDDYAYAVAVDSSGNVVVTGYSSGSGSSYDYYTAKYAASNGALLWEKRYNSPANSHDQAQSVAVDDTGNVVVAGSSYGTNGYDYYTAKYAAADGALLWEKRYNGPVNGDDFVGGTRFYVGGAHSLAIGPNGMVAITGSSGDDYATIVYRESLSPVSIALLPAGVRLSSTGTPGRSYNIERSPAVTGPWTVLNTQIAPTSGLLEYLAPAPLPGQAFYRTVQP